MALSERMAQTEIVVSRNGEAIVYEQLEVLNDAGEVVARGERVGRVIVPGADVSREVERVKAIAEAVHKPEVVAAWQADRQRSEELQAMLAAEASVKEGR